MTTETTDMPQQPAAVGAQVQRGVRALDPERADFEQWRLSCAPGLDLSRNMPDGSYNNPSTHEQWQAWQAARAWVPTSERKPKGGQLIVKRWRHGAVWAGTHNEGPKNEAFDEWKAL